MPTNANLDPEQQPLLQAQDASTLESRLTKHHKSSSLSSSSTSIEEGQQISNFNSPVTRAVEDDVLPEASPLGRTLSWQSAYILAISRVVGSGIFATPGAIAQSVGSVGLSLSLWLIGAVIAACGLAVALEYGCMLPRSGGTKVYLEFTYRWPRLLASTLYALYAVFLGFTASNCVVFSRYVLFALGQQDAGAFLSKGLAVALLSAVTVVHGVFPQTGIKIQNGLGWIKIGVVIFMILSGIYVVLFRPDTDSIIETRSQLSWEHLWENSSWNWGVISTSLFKVFYSYSGLDNVSNVLNEVKDPVRTLRSVALTALATACSMYFLINVAYFLVVPVDEIRESGELIAALFFERLFGASVGRRILPLAVALSACGNVMVVAFALARVKQEIARQGFLPFGDLLSSSRPFGSPLGGFLVNYIPSMLVIILPPSGTVYSFILEVEGYAGELIGLAVAVGLLKLRFQRPDLKRPFKAWTPAILVKIAIALGLLSAPFFHPPDRPDNGLFYATYAIVGATIFAVGVVYWYVWTIAIPRWRGYTLEEDTRVLVDGTSVTKFRYR
ncbi:amino acid permease-domain-containing protein [Mariannaea sp. PMI_226]|nr:amino acid permease-domain-containing protein [Mariannaea sp. PMI_226]